MRFERVVVSPQVSHRSPSEIHVVAYEPHPYNPWKHGGPTLLRTYHVLIGIPGTHTRPMTLDPSHARELALALQDAADHATSLTPPWTGR
jgi:hypothetical protein